MRSTTAHLRVGRLTASRVPKILGLSPHGGPESVMREMVREAHGLAPDPGNEWVTEYGTENEARAIRDYERVRDVLVYRAGDRQETVVHPKHDILAGTPDGLVDMHAVAEIKCPRRATYTHIDQRRDYWVQIQVQLACTARRVGDFVVWRAPGLPKVLPLISTVDYDPGWLPTVLPELYEFHEQYRLIVRTPELSEPYRLPLVDERADPEWAEAAREWLDAKHDAKRAKAAQDDAEARLIELAGGRKTRGCGASVSPPGKGRINYKDVVEKYSPDADLEHFRAAAPSKPIVREVAIR